eukprot:TRINITY_DN6633_c0_g1_i19.p2 TRINITY_DN6633_c0_g1~~TRINITY_DN6633_c0_g1_i19.p2  ORF type:complete len:649 (-),score=155.02 TRINITY_DN6633_c0_g1_i19:238-2184(-)
MVLRQVSQLVVLSGEKVQSTFLLSPYPQDNSNPKKLAKIRGTLRIETSWTSKEPRFKPRHFGRPLIDSLQQAQHDETLHIFYNTLSTLKHHLQTEGLFRLPGSANNIQALESSIDHGLHVSLLDQPVHDIGSLCKAYFAQLPDPLLPEQFYEEFKECGHVEDREEKLSITRELIQKLPLENREVFIDLTTFLHGVSLHSQTNKMTPRNLAVCWTPTIIIPKTISVEPSKMFMDTNATTQYLSWIIENSPVLWPPIPSVEVEVKMITKQFHPDTSAQPSALSSSLRSYKELFHRHLAPDETEDNSRNLQMVRLLCSTGTTTTVLTNSMDSSLPQNHSQPQIQHQSQQQQHQQQPQPQLSSQPVSPMLTITDSEVSLSPASTGIMTTYLKSNKSNKHKSVSNALRRSAQTTKTLTKQSTISETINLADSSSNSGPATSSTTPTTTSTPTPTPTGPTKVLGRSKSGKKSSHMRRLSFAPMVFAELMDFGDIRGSTESRSGTDLLESEEPDIGGGSSGSTCGVGHSAGVGTNVSFASTPSTYCSTSGFFHVHGDGDGTTGDQGRFTSSGIDGTCVSATSADGTGNSDGMVIVDIDSSYSPQTPKSRGNSVTCLKYQSLEKTKQEIQKLVEKTDPKDYQELKEFLLSLMDEVN